MMQQIAEQLLCWYDTHSRTLPWRNIRDPYATWVSETMLQQTRVETVLTYYDRFLTAFPTVEALAEASEEAVLKLWEGLGYYRRAKNLHRGAKQVMADFDGVIPHSVPELRQITGIGDYTAGAIASIAFGQRVPAVDGNVIRVVTRLAGIRENVGIPSVKRKLTAEVALLVPEHRPGDFNQALMDLGASVCVPGTPDCEHCPLRTHCDAYAADDADTLPVLPRKNPPKVIDYDVCLIVRRSRVLMQQRTESLLQGLWVYPMLEGHTEESKLPALVRKRFGIRCTEAIFAGEAKHVFTHQVWQMRLYILKTTEDAPTGFLFADQTDMTQLTIPTAMRGARKAVAQWLKANGQETDEKVQGDR